jgi:transposase
MSDLPSDSTLLRQTVITLSSRLAALSAEYSTLSAERDAAIAQRDAAVQENDKLLTILSQYKRTIFGPRSETLDPGQLSLFTITAQVARAAANDDVTGGGLPDGAEGRGKRPARRNRGKLPEHLPRIDVVIDIESHICPCCGERLHKIGRPSRKPSTSSRCSTGLSALCVRGTAAGDVARVCCRHPRRPRRSMAGW